jgi:hypothetical protein
MKLRHWVGLILAGGLFVLYGITKFHQHAVFPYLNLYRQPVFPPAVVMIGVVFAALAFRPPAKWIDRLISPKPKREAHALQVLHEHRHKHKGNR